MKLLNKLKELNQIRKLSSGNILRITCINGNIIEGKYLFYTSELDNEPEEAEVCVRSLKTESCIGILEHEIKSIEIID